MRTKGECEVGVPVGVVGTGKEQVPTSSMATLVDEGGKDASTTDEVLKHISVCNITRYLGNPATQAELFCSSVITAFRGQNPSPLFYESSRLALEY